MKKVYIIGVGLIGGSFAMAIKKESPDATIYGIDNNEAHLKEAKSLKVIDRQTDMSTIGEADLVILAIPVDASVFLLPSILDAVNDDALVIDVGSTKETICKSVEQHAKRRNFLAMHPIAGTEFSGPKAAKATLFKNKVNIICEVEKTASKLQVPVIALLNKLGMELRYLNPKAHDKHIAYMSHLSHISAFMLGKTVLEEEKSERDIFDMAGSGFASTVRLAKSSPAMWTPIFKHNKANVLETLQAYISNLENFKSLIEKDDFDAVYNDMQDTNYIKNVLNGIPK